MKTLLSAAFLSLFSLASTAAQAEPVALTLKLVDEAGKPLAGLGVRVAIGSEAETLAIEGSSPGLTHHDSRPNWRHASSPCTLLGGGFA